MRRERAALQPDLGEVALKPLQSRCEHLGVGVNYAAPDDLAGRVYNAHRRPLAAHIQSCKYAHRCSPFVIHESPAKASHLPPESSNLMYGMY
jgi:hypothetical protein